MRVKVLHKTTGAVMWITEEGLGKALAEGHKLANPELQKPKEVVEPKAEEPKAKKATKKK